MGMRACEDASVVLRRVPRMGQVAGLAAGLLVVVLCVPCSADFTLIFENGVDGYEGASDVQVYTLDRSTDLSKASFLMWDGNGIPLDQQMILMRFLDLVGDLPNEIPPGRTVTQAVIRMQVNPDPGGGNSGQFAQLHEMLVPFVNGPYDAQPFADDLPVPGVHYREEGAVEIPGPPHEAVLRIDVTEGLNAWLSGARENHGWLLLPGGSNGVIVRSADFKLDGMRRPELIVDTPVGQFLFRDGLNGYQGCIDTWVEENDRVRDVGRASDTLADGGVSGGNADGTWPLIRFEGIFGAGPGQIPTGTQIDSAHLRIAVHNGGNGTTLHDLKPGHPFNELSAGEAEAAGVTHTNYNTFGEVVLGFGSEFYDINAVVDEIPPGFMGPIRLDVTSSLQRYSSGDENTGWVFSHDGAFGGNNDGVEWHSSDWDDPRDVPPEQQPELIVVTSEREYRFMDRKNGYRGTVDTFVEENVQDRDVGRSGSLLVDGGLSGETPDGTWALMRFDNIIGQEPDQIPAGAQIQTAILRLSVHNPGNETTLHNLKPGHPFNELSGAEALAAGVDPTNFLTFGDIRVDGGAAYFDINDVVDSIPAFTEGLLDLDVTSSIQAVAGGAENTGWIFQHEGAFGGPADGAEWRSSEWGPNEPPKLLVDTSIGPFVFQDGVNGYRGTVDTQVNSGDSAHLVLGNDSTFWSDGEDANGDNSVLLRFDRIIGNGPGQIPPGTTINSAMVTLVIVNEGGFANVYDILPGWPFDDESTTFNSFGDLLFGEGEIYDPTVLATSPGPGGTGPWEFDVTASVQGYAAGDPNAGWAIIPILDEDFSTNGTGYFSHEGLVEAEESGAAKLIVTVEGQPNEPVAVREYMLY